MVAAILRQIKQAFTTLNPEEVRKLANAPLHVGMRSASDYGYQRMENFLLPPTLSPARRAELREWLHRMDAETSGEGYYNLELYEYGVPPSREGFVFYPHDPEKTVRVILNEREDLHLALARRFPPFRQEVVSRLIQRVAKENAIFALMTALPNVVPSWLLLPWAVGEFASDTAVLTTNQVRMAFLIAAASDRDVGFREQRGQIASVILSAFGWRALARELVGKIPLGGGLAPKAAVAYAGTYVVGRSLERFFSLGYTLTRQERRDTYETALEKGKGFVAAIVEQWKREKKIPEGSAV